MRPHPKNQLFISGMIFFLYFSCLLCIWEKKFLCYDSDCLLMLFLQKRHQDNITKYCVKYCWFCFIEAEKKGSNIKKKRSCLKLSGKELTDKIVAIQPVIIWGSVWKFHTWYLHVYPNFFTILTKCGSRSSNGSTLCPFIRQAYIYYSNLGQCLYTYEDVCLSIMKKFYFLSLSFPCLKFLCYYNSMCTWRQNTTKK